MIIFISTLSQKIKPGIVKCLKMSFRNRTLRFLKSFKIEKKSIKIAEIKFSDFCKIVRNRLKSVKIVQKPI